MKINIILLIINIYLYKKKSFKILVLKFYLKNQIYYEQVDQKVKIVNNFFKIDIYIIKYKK